VGARNLKILDGMVQAALNFLKAPIEFLRFMDEASRKTFMDLAIDLYLKGGALG
jgi:hypothetical protein